MSVLVQLVTPSSEHTPEKTGASVGFGVTAFVGLGVVGELVVGELVVGELVGKLVVG